MAAVPIDDEYASTIMTMMLMTMTMTMTMMMTMMMRMNMHQSDELFLFKGDTMLSTSSESLRN